MTRCCRLAASSFALGWVLLLGCFSDPAGMAEPEGYEGLLALGWEAVADGRPGDAFERFRAAIETDVTRPEAYLGAGVACSYLEERWGETDDYYRMAIQRETGHSAVFTHLAESQVQDTMWTVFRCIDPDIPPDSLETWLEQTSDSGYVWVNSRILDYLQENGYDTALSFRFAPVAEAPLACLQVVNSQSGRVYGCDSVKSDSIYFTAEHFGYLGWVSVGHCLTYDYSSLRAGGGTGQTALDALACWTLFQDLRGAEGDPLRAAACAQAVLNLDPSYVFGDGYPARQQALSLYAVEVAAGAASCSFLDESFIYAWFLCREAGYGYGLDPESEDFLFALMELINQMQGEGG